MKDVAIAVNQFQKVVQFNQTMQLKAAFILHVFSASLLNISTGLQSFIFISL